MSEYQYYEFRKIGSALSDKAMQEISGLSSRAEVTRTSATFTYDYGNFRGDPIKVLERHFDALFYMTNWGSRRLAFRFPVSAVDYTAFRRFELGDAIGITRKGAHLIVDMFFEDESLCEWGDDDGALGRIVGLYEDLLAGDYRSLFLLWLQAAFLEYEEDPDVPLPPIPAGLQELSKRHQALSDLFGTSPDLIAASSLFSAPVRQESDEDLAQALDSIPGAEQTGLLRRIILGESAAVVIAELRKRLRDDAQKVEPSVAGRLPAPASAGVIFAKARQIRADRERKAVKQNAARELQRLKTVERDEMSLWRRVDELIAGKTIGAYDEAIEILKDLRDLAVHRQRKEDFALRVGTIQGKHRRLIGLQWRIEQAGLV